MTRLTNIALIFCLTIVLIGCQHTSPSDGVEVTSLQDQHDDNAKRRVDSRLLEEADQRASNSAEEQAKAYLQTTSFAKLYAVFQRSRVLAHGGYSARFGSSSNSIGGVCYFFDEQGQVLRIEKRSAPYGGELF
jgi:hypothetical protein